MRLIRCNALVVCALLSTTASTTPVPDVEACIHRLDPQLDIGYDRIAQRCPDLVRQMDSGAWAAWLPRGWKETGNDLSAGSLREFRELVARESAATAASRAPDVLRLRTILTSVAGTGEESGWSRFESWLRSILERREQPVDESWFSRMVSHVGVSQSVIRLITYAALCLVVVLALVIVANEIRNAGVFSKQPRPARKRLGIATVDASNRAWGNIERAPSEDRPRLLLELIVRRLSERGLLPPAGALTVRELARAVRLPEADDRSRFATLALLAERVRFASRDSRPVDADESLTRGRELLDRLNASTQR
jgi:Domain of unknown function (DUF4129)